MQKKILTQLPKRGPATRRQLEEEQRHSRMQRARSAGKLVGGATTHARKLSAAHHRAATGLPPVQEDKAEYKQLFLQARELNEKRRHLTHEIINAQEKERKALSRTLHDEVLQMLVGLDFELNDLNRDAPEGGKNLEARLARTRQLVKSSVTAVHRFARGLRPAALDDFGLIPALEMYIGDLTADKKFTIQLTAPEEIESMGASQRTVLFRVAQEALDNISRHAHASRVEVSIRQDADKILMEISDNGRGFSADSILAATNPKHLGLVAMRERLEMIGGTLTIQSIPGKGTRLSAQVPFTEQAA